MSELMSVSELISYSRSLTDEPCGRGSTEIRHTAKQAATVCKQDLETGLTLDECWRYTVLQLLDDYTSTVKRAGVAVAKGVFADAPGLTGSQEIDAALAALCQWLADRDGWNTPQWAMSDERRLSSPWFPDDNALFHEDAKTGSPAVFRQRNIFVTQQDLSRA